MTGREDGAASRLTYEKSKYLGGDIEHTHLVKGLDYALLEQVKKTETAPTAPAYAAAFSQSAHGRRTLSMATWCIGRTMRSGRRQPRPRRPTPSGPTLLRGW
jgi:hypothetical protein